MGKFSLAVDTAEYLKEQGIHVAMGTFSDLDDEGLQVAFYTVNGIYLQERFSVSEWASAVAIGDQIINLYNHDGLIPPPAGESLYKYVSHKYTFGGWKARRDAIRNATLVDLLAAYRIAADAQDQTSMDTLAAWIDTRG